jgi:hypothetical protein
MTGYDRAWPDSTGQKMFMKNVAKTKVFVNVIAKILVFVNVFAKIFVSATVCVKIFAKTLHFCECDGEYFCFRDSFCENFAYSTMCW